MYDITIYLYTCILYIYNYMNISNLERLQVAVTGGYGFEGVTLYPIGYKNNPNG